MESHARRFFHELAGKLCAASHISRSMFKPLTISWFGRLNFLSAGQCRIVLGAGLPSYKVSIPSIQGLKMLTGVQRRLKCLWKCSYKSACSAMPKLQRLAVRLSLKCLISSGIRADQRVAQLLLFGPGTTEILDVNLLPYWKLDAHAGVLVDAYSDHPRRRCRAQFIIIAASLAMLNEALSSMPKH